MNIEKGITIRRKETLYIYALYIYAISLEENYSSGSHPMDFNFYSESIKLHIAKFTLIIILERYKKILQLEGRLENIMNPRL